MKYILAAACVVLTGYALYLSDQLDRKDKLIAAYDEVVVIQDGNLQKSMRTSDQCLDQLLGRDL